jgi:5,10-methylenetetrahydromethanopterin reductase
VVERSIAWICHNRCMSKDYERLCASGEAFVYGCSNATKEAARVITAFYIPSMPQQLIERHGIDYESVRPIVEAFGSGDVGRVLELTSSEVGAKLSIAGTPEEWVEKIETDVLPSGFNHLIVAIADPYIVKSWSGMSIEGLPDTSTQLRLIEERVIPMLQ